MDFSDQMGQLADRIEKLKPQLFTEEATKTALIMPFIQALGYDVFNPLEVIPEFTSDVGIKKGEKVDYAIVLDKKIIMLIECKGINDPLMKHDTQLIRYFQACEARFAILTNGQVFKFFTDLDDHNRMDSKPFFEFDLLNIKEQQIAELKKFHKAYFDIDKIVGTASELKYSNEIKTILNSELEDPSETFVKFFIQHVYSGRATANVIEQFKSIVKRSLTQWISDKISSRLKTALEKENENDKIEAENVEEQMNTDSGKLNIETTEEELEGYYIVRSILRRNIDVKRIVHRDTQTYFGILMDDNNRKPICRLYFNSGKKKIELFDENKKSIKYDIETLDDIYTHSDHLLKTLTYYN